MLKNIAVIVENISVDYTIEALTGIADFYRNKDVALTIFPCRYPNASDSEYDYQYWIGISYAIQKYFDAVIVISSPFCSTMTASELTELLKGIDSRKIVSVGIPLPKRNISYTFTKCESTYTNVISHLVSKHNCKRIAFFSATATGSIEAIERYEAYKKALKNNNLQFDEALVFDGQFTYSSAYNLFKTIFTSKEDVKFDAILCSNDMMAFGCIAALNEINVKIPEDVKVIGYDDIYRAKHTYPTLSTINQMIPKQGYETAKLAYKIACNEPVEKSSEVEIEPCYRQSCGCISLNQTSSFEKSRDLPNMEEIFSAYKFRDIVNSFIDQMQNTETLENYYKKLDVFLYSSSFSAIAICLYEDAIELNRNKKFHLPNRIVLSAAAEEKKIKAQSMSNTFNPHYQIIPEDTFSKASGIYLFHPIFNGKKQFGYIYSRLEDDTFYQHHIYLKVFSHGISLAYEFSKSLEQNDLLNHKNELLQIMNNKLNQKNQTDELTKILNRRGFLDLGQKAILFALDMGNTGLVFFGDMNHLKDINDTYGHEMGDKAIKAQAEILKRSLRQNDVIGRLSGDEFAAVICGPNMDNIDTIREKVNNNAKIVSKEKKFPFEISISLGAVEFDSRNFELSELIKSADKKQYEAKRKAHAERR